MSITFNVNQKAQKSLSTQVLFANPVQATIDGRVKSVVEASGANFPKVIGRMMDPSMADAYEDLDESFRAKFAKSFQGVSVFSHGLMEAIHLSYAQHYPLVLTPDTIWLTIAQGFAAHVNANAEKLRKRFVSHEGKKMILLRRDEFVKGSAHNDWPGCFSEFSDRLADHLGKKRDLVVSDFSTTGPIEKAASELVLMDSMKAYFKYAVMTCCGIPSLTLTGTVQDWKSIRTRAENLAEYELDWWIKPLLPVLDKLVATAEGNPDIGFWDTLYKQDGGSGGPYCSGWCNVLFPYITDYRSNPIQNPHVSKWQGGFMSGPTMDAYPNSLSKVPFKWQIGESTTYDMEFLGGIVGVHQHNDLSLEPAIGWAVRDTGTVTQAPIDPNEDW